MKKTTRFFVLAAAFAACGTAHAQSNIDFETVGQDWTWTVFQNGPGGSDVPANLTAPFANPNKTGINTSANVARFIEDATAQPWGGFFSDNIGSFTVSATNKIVKVMVHKDKISPFGVKFEGAGGNHEILIPNTKINEWELLTYDFTSQIGKTFTRLVFLPDFATPRASGGTTYIDNITFSDGTTGFNSVSADIYKVTCYPNPAAKEINVSAAAEINQVIVRNLLGQSVKEVIVNGLEKSIDLSAISSGNYFLTVKFADGKISTQKFVKL